MMKAQSSAPVKEKTLKIISDLLTDICDESTTGKDTNNSKKIPSISIRDFFERIVKYTHIENSTLVLILIYIDRLCDMQKFRLNYYNIHKIIISSMVIAIKYNEDEYCDNNFYAKVGGVSRKEIDKLEYETLSLLNFTLFVNEDLFDKYNNYIRSVEVEEEEETEEDENEQKQFAQVINDKRCSIPVS